MAQLTRQVIQTLAKLSRIHCTPEEEDRLLADLGKIIDYVEQLNAVDTTDVQPCYQVLEGMAPALREDEVSAELSRELFLSNAPDQLAGMIRVPPILQQE